MIFNKYKKALDSFLNQVFQYPSVQDWIRRHPKLTSQIKKRLSTKEFMGLPLTLLGGAFLYAVALLLGIVQDYLAHDPLIAADVRIANLLYALRSDQLLHFFYTTTLLAESGVIIAAALVLSIFVWFQRQRVFAFGLWLTLIP